MTSRVDNNAKVEQALLLKACREGDLQVLQQHLEQQQQQDLLHSVQDSEGNNLLMTSAFHGHLLLVKFLLEDARLGEREAYLHARNKMGDNVLSRAVLGDHVSVVDFLLNHAAIKTLGNIANKRGQTPARQIKSVEIAKLFIQHGVVIQKNANGWNDLMWAGSEGLLALCEALVESGNPLSNKDKLGKTALIIAVERDQLDIVKFFISKGADIEATDKDGRTPLIWAAAKGHLPMVKVLVENGSIVNSVDSKGTSPLTFAAIQNSVEIISLLVENNAMINMEDKDGLTALHKAASFGHLEVVQWLLANNASCESSNKKVGHAIFLAAQSGKSSILQSFIDKGVDINLKNERGETPLLAVAKRGKSDLAKILIDFGADASITNADGSDYNALLKSSPGASRISDRQQAFQNRDKERKLRENKERAQSIGGQRINSDQDSPKTDIRNAMEARKNKQRPIRSGVNIDDSVNANLDSDNTNINDRKAKSDFLSARNKMLERSQRNPFGNKSNSLSNKERSESQTHQTSEPNRSNSNEQHATEISGLNLSENIALQTQTSALTSPTLPTSITVEDVVNINGGSNLSENDIIALRTEASPSLPINIIVDDIKNATHEHENDIREASPKLLASEPNNKQAIPEEIITDSDSLIHFEPSVGGDRDVVIANKSIGEEVQVDPQVNFEQYRNSSQMSIVEQIIAANISTTQIAEIQDFSESTESYKDWKDVVDAVSDVTSSYEHVFQVIFNESNSVFHSEAINNMMELRQYHERELNNNRARLNEVIKHIEKFQAHSPPQCPALVSQGPQQGHTMYERAGYFVFAFLFVMIFFRDLL